jgi:hypothetical protein
VGDHALDDGVNKRHAAFTRRVIKVLSGSDRQRKR